ncbi:MAG: helix-turn-helix transcriptional regulator [Candidatus Adiutrix sp.]
MTSTMIRQFMRLTEFLGTILGPDYEIALHDLSDKNNTIIALANGHVSGRSLDSPLSSTALQVLSERSYETRDYQINYSGVAVGKKILRTSTFYIKDDRGALVGMLCINFDDSRYQDISNKILGLCHPDAFVDANFIYNPDKARLENIPASEDAENFYQSMPEMAEDMIENILKAKNITPGRLTRAEKISIVEELKNKGAFQLKGAVKQIATRLNCSQATVYRYLST